MHSHRIGWGKGFPHGRQRTHPDRIDPDVKARATEVLDASGLTVSDALRILLTRTARKGVLPAGPVLADADHDTWFRNKVREALEEDTRPDTLNDVVQAEFTARRADTTGNEERLSSRQLKRENPERERR